MSPTRTLTHADSIRPAPSALVLVSLATLLAVAASPRDAGAACSTAICSGGGSACTITGTNTIDDDCTLNWAGTDVTLASGATLRTAADGQNFTVITDDFDVSGTIQSRGAPSATPLSITAGGYVNIHSTGKIDVGRGGNLEVNATGAVQHDGTEITADGGGGSDDAGRIFIFSSGSSITTTGVIHATGAGGGFGGHIWLNADGATSIGAAVTANGSAGATFHHDGGTVWVTSGGDLTIGANVMANGDGTSAIGGSIDIDSAGNAIVTAKLHANGASDGDGGGIVLAAADEVELEDTVRVNGGSAGGTGGGIEISGASVLVKGDWAADGGNDVDGGTITIDATNGDFELQGTGFMTANGSTAATGGTITISATGNATLSGELFSTATGGGTGGDITVTAEGNVVVAADVIANASGADSSGGNVVLTGGTNHTVTVSQTVDARTTSSTGWADGSISIDACNVTITNTGMVRTRNTSVDFWGTNTIEYMGSFTISGSALADDPAPTVCGNPPNGNVFLCRCVDTTPADGVCDTPETCVSNPTTAGATITPAALVCPVMKPACS